MPESSSVQVHVLPALAPLTLSLAQHLVDRREKKWPKEAGRRPNDPDVIAERDERRRIAGMKIVTSDVAAARDAVYQQLINADVQAGGLTRDWLVQALKPYVAKGQLVWPDRLRQWKGVNLLRYDGREPEPQSTAALLIMREVLREAEKEWLPPRLEAPESYWVWRKRAPHLEAEPYYLPFEGPELPGPEDESPFLLWTPWKGVSWSDRAWLVVENGAIRWTGSLTDEQMDQWLTQEEIPSLPDVGSERATEALRLLAHRILSHF